jgi:hypothetical protein
MKLYSTPIGGHPQELPDRWKFPDGTVRTDLKLLSDAELLKLGWIGPIDVPQPHIQKVDETGQPILDADGNPVIIERDYDLNTHKAVWYRAKRKYIIVEHQIDEAPYDSGELLPEDIAKLPDWDTFEGIILQSKEMRDFIAFASTKNPLVASTFPAAFFEAKNGKYNSFNTVWNELIKISPVNVNVIESIIGVALSLNLPEEFIGIIKDTLSHILDGSSQIAQDPDWDTFESLVLQSEEMKNFISIANAENPLIASTFAPAFFEVKNEKYNSFRIVWGELTKISPVDPNVLGAIINVAKSCDLPQEFIKILEG